MKIKNHSKIKMHPSKTIKGTNKGMNGNKPLKKGIFKSFCY